MGVGGGIRKKSFEGMVSTLVIGINTQRILEDEEWCLELKKSLLRAC